MNGPTPREFRTQVIDLRREVRAELRRLESGTIGVMSCKALLERTVELLDTLEDPLTRFVMYSPGGMRKRD